MSNPSASAEKQLSWRSLPRIGAGIALGLIALLIYMYVVPLQGGSNVPTAATRSESPESVGSKQVQHATNAHPIGLKKTRPWKSSGGPSFDCAKAHSKTELLICADPELSDEDKSLARSYARGRDLAADKEAFVHDGQLAWQWREAHCSDTSCLLQWYDDRSNQLAHLIMQSSPTGTSTPCAPLYNETIEEARQRYISIFASYVRRHGQTEDEFFRHVGSNEANVMSFSLAAENCGASIVDGLRTLDAMGNSLGQ